MASKSKANAAQPSTGPSAEIPSDRMQELFIPVHGFVHLYPEEVAVLSHPAFQRLRRVRQLGFAHMVFPGAVHTRFEHSIGAVHVAQRIIDNVNRNYHRNPQSTSNNEDYILANLSPPIEMFARLGALLHDIGHVPFGHTLEDELEHIDKHDGQDRINRICNVPFSGYNLDDSLGLNADEPSGGWSLGSLVSSLYAPYLDILTESSNRQGIGPFDILCMIIAKAPSKADKLGLETWIHKSDLINTFLPLQACRDLVGNTICADFLDYLYRDLYHIGKPHNEDKRLYQYMEIRVPKGTPAQFAQQQFVINVGFPQKHRHDALTNILQMLDLRYQLAETVLFHRTKLSVTALLDRCLLEVRRLFRACNLKTGSQGWEAYLRGEILNAMLRGSDDGLPDILNSLAGGGQDESVRQQLSAAMGLQEAQLRGHEGPPGQGNLLGGPGAEEDNGALQENGVVGGEDHLPPAHIDIASQIILINKLAECLRNRTIFTLAQKVRIEQLGSVPETEKHDAYEVARVIRWYASPDNRSLFIDAVERMCGLPSGSLIIYIPPSSKMNAKIADVKLYIDGRIQTLWEYETEMPSASLTAGALRAQVRRFFYLWNAQFFVERSLWHSMSPGIQEALRSVLERMFYLPPGKDPTTARRETEVSVKAVREAELRAARGGVFEDTMAEFGNKTIMERIPIICP